MGNNVAEGLPTQSSNRDKRSSLLGVVGRQVALMRARCRDLCETFCQELERGNAEACEMLERMVEMFENGPDEPNPDDWGDESWEEQEWIPGVYEATLEVYRKMAAWSASPQAGAKEEHGKTVQPCSLS